MTKRTFLPLWVLVFNVLLFHNASAQKNETKLEQIVDRFNKELSIEEGCSKQEYSLKDCTLHCTLECGGQDFTFLIQLNELQRVYTTKADFDDDFDTLFFECKDGNNCIVSASGKIPPTPVFPVKLPSNGTTLGAEAVNAFSSAIDRCH